MRPAYELVRFLSIASVVLAACQLQGPAEPDDAGLDGGALQVRSTEQALEQGSLCGSMAGLQTNAPWPMRSGCPGHSGRASDVGPATAVKNWSFDTFGDVRSSAAIAADGSLLIGGDNGKVYKLNPSTGAIVKQLSLGGAIKSSPAIGNNDTVYVTNDAGKLSAVTLSTFLLKWSYTVGGTISSSPVVLSDGSIVFGSNNKSVFSVTSAGAKRWSYLTAGPVTSSPAVSTDGATVFIGSQDTFFYALDTTTGALRWKTQLAAGVASSPALTRFNLVVVGAGDKMYALDATTGAIVWQRSLGSSTVYSPSISEAGLVVVGVSYSAFTGGSVYALKPADGSILWQFDTLSGIETTPVIDRLGNAYVGGNDGALYGITSAGKLIFKHTLPNGALAGIKSSPVIASGGRLVFGGDDNWIYSFGSASQVLVPSGGVCTADSACQPGLLCGNDNGLRFGKPAGSKVCWLPSCENKVKDPTETEIDCGGPCGACTNICSQSCTAGSQVAPPALEVLSFSKGAFSRASEGTYQTSANKVALARGDQLRYEDRGDGNGRVALFEGPRTNRIVWSESMGHAPEWWTGVAQTPTMILTEDTTVSPSGVQTADRWQAQAGGNAARAQTIVNAMPAGSLSAWLRLTNPASFNPASPLKTRTVLTDLTGGWYNEVLDWSLPAAWERRSMVTTPATKSTAVQMSHKGAWPGSATQFPALPAADFAVWGWQLEEGLFPSSYIPTQESGVTRKVDQVVFETTVVPTWLHTGLWQIDVLPLYSSAEIATTDEFVLMAWEGGQLSLAKDATGGLIKLVSGTTTAKRPIAWTRNRKLSLTIDATAKTLQVIGATTGDGSQSYGSIAIGTGRVGLGALLDGTKPAFARISEPRKVTSATVACVPDPDCARCGDGAINGTEVCDFGLDPHCALDCKSVGTTVPPCSEDTDCPSGLLCSSYSGELYGAAGLSGVCVPGICLTNPASACGTTQAPCGICLCTSQCDGKGCGTSADNGCGGECTGLCDVGDNCADNSDCAQGQYCGVNNGSYFGKPTGTRVCWDPLCEFGGATGVNCGTLACIPSCDGKSCGDDGCGGSCGTCAGTCIEGACLLALPFNPPGPLVAPLAPVLPASTDPVGTLPGAMSVGPSGAGEYSIPLEVPPAQDDLQPHLSFTYNSNRGNGLLGMGWSVTGPELSVIARCPRTSLDPGGAKPVSYTKDDKFCLDGMPLVEIPVSLSEYPATVPVREYRTELDSFSRVLFIGEPRSDQPSQWLVLTKSGRQQFYGSTSNSRILQQRSDEGTPAVAASWALDRIVDRAGNELRVTFDRERLRNGSIAGSSEIHPLAIIYGKLSADKKGADRMVSFQYDNSRYGGPKREDVITGYRGGRLFRRAARLVSVATSFLEPRSGTTVVDPTVRKYWLDYKSIPADQNADGDDGMGRPVTEPSRLTSIQVCAGGQARTANAQGCLPATAFTYAIDLEGKPRQGGFPNGAQVEAKEPPLGLLFDMNGDGKADRAWAEDGKFQLDIGETPIAVGNTPADPPNPQNGPAEALVSMQLGQSPLSGAPTLEAVLKLAGKEDPSLASDLNLDGRVDLVYPFADQKQIVVFRSQGNSFAYTAHATANTAFKSKDWILFDVDGDGYQDLFRCGAPFGFLRNTGASFETETTLPNATAIDSLTGILSCPNQGGKGRPITLDTDGDGVSNLLLNWESGAGIKPLLTAVRFVKSGTTWSLVAVPTGLSRIMKNDPKETEKPEDVRPIVIDLNGDGLTDLLVPRRLSDAPKRPGDATEVWQDYCGSDRDTSRHKRDKGGCIGLQVWINTNGTTKVFKNQGFLDARYQRLGVPEVNPGVRGQAVKVTVPAFAMLVLQAASGVDIDGDGRQDLVMSGVPVWRLDGTSASTTAEYSWRVYRGFRELAGDKATPAEFLHTSELRAGLGNLSSADFRSRVEFADFDGNGVVDVHIWQAREKKTPIYKENPATGEEFLDGYLPALEPARWYGLSGRADRMNLVQAKNGLGRLELFEYKSGTGPHYEAVLDAACSYGTRCFQHLPSPVVMGYSFRSASAGNTIYRRFQRSYKALRADPLKRSAVGFAEVTEREVLPTASNPQDADTISTSVTTYDQRIAQTKFGKMRPYASRPLSTEYVVSVQDGDISRFPRYRLRKKREFLWNVKNSDAAVPFVYLEGTVDSSIATGVTTSPLPEILIDTVVEQRTGYGVDSYGNTWQSLTEWADGAITTERTDFYLDADHIKRWQTDLPKIVRQSFTRARAPGGPLQLATTRRTAFEYYDNGLLFATTREPSDPSDLAASGSWQLHGHRTELARDPNQHFNVISVREFGARADNDRRTVLNWASDSIAPDSVTDDLGHVMYMAVDRGTGELLWTKAQDGVVTKWARDKFGRAYTIETPLGTARIRRTPATQSSSNGILVDAAYQVIEDGLDGTQQATSYNSLGMQVANSTEGLGGTSVFQEFGYDIRGQLTAASRPYSSPGNQGVIKFERDDAGRLLSTKYPDGTSVTNLRARAAFLRSELSFVEAVPGDMVEGTINPRGAIKLSRQRPRGLTTATFETAGNGVETRPEWLPTRYYYTGFDGLWRIQDPEGQVTEFERDVYNRVTKRVDPASGTSRYTYDGFDQIRGSDDAKAQHIDYGYDSLGRLTSRTGASGTASWDWDCPDDAETTACKGQDIGKIVRAKRGDVTTDYTYYPLTGLTATQTMSITGQGKFSTAATYLNNGNVETVTLTCEDAARANQASYAVKYTYEQSGGDEVISISKVGATTPLWELKENYQAFAPQLERFGNGTFRRTTYYDTNGRVQRLIDGPSSATPGAASNLSDRYFTYDENGNVKTSGAFPDARGYEYDLLDRLKRVTSIGNVVESFDYDPAGNLMSKHDVGAYVYQDATKPCVPTSATSCDGVYTAYRPHAARSAGTTTFVYDNNGNEELRTTPSGTLRTDYTDFNLPRLITPNGNAAQAVSFRYNADGERVAKSAAGSTTVFMGDAYQRTVDAAGVKHEFFIPLSGGQLHVTRDAAGERSEYILADHLGSSSLTVSSTGQATRRTFDSFGQVIGSTSPPVGRDQPGFTGHRHDTDVGLINMKGRMFDAKLGRFTQPDPIMALPVGTGLNRYAYVLNNPLKYTDPWGLAPTTTIKEPVIVEFPDACKHGGCAEQAERAAQQAVNQAAATEAHLSARAEQLAMHQPGGGPTTGQGLTGGGLARTGSDSWWQNIEFGNPPGSRGPTDKNGSPIIIASPIVQVDPAEVALVVAGVKAVKYAAKIPILGPAVQGAAKRFAKPVAEVAVKGLVRFFARLGRMQGHHALPMFLGGAFKQILSRIPAPVHAELHSILAANLKAAGLDLPIGGIEGSALAWERYFLNNPGAQEKAINAVIDASVAIDAKYGTNATWDVLQNAILGNYRVL